MLTVGQNNFGNKIPVLKKKLYTFVHLISSAYLFLSRYEVSKHYTIGAKTVWSRIHLFINQKVCKCSAGGRAEKLEVQVTIQDYLTFNLEKKLSITFILIIFIKILNGPNRFHKIDPFDLLINNQ